MINVTSFYNAVLYFHILWQHFCDLYTYKLAPFCILAVTFFMTKINYEIFRTTTTTLSLLKINKS